MRLDQQTITNPLACKLNLAAGMTAQAEIHQGTWAVLENLLSPVKKAEAEVVTGCAETRLATDE